MHFDRTSFAYLFLVVAIIATAVAVTIFVGGRVPADTDRSRIQPVSENDAYTTLDGDAVDLSSYEDVVVVVSAWASWCSLCIEELSQLSELAGEFPQDEVLVVAINRREPAQTARAFLDHIGVPDHVLIVLDDADSFYTLVGGFDMPETVIYDRSGTLSAHRRGPVSLSELRMLVAQARDH